MGRAENKRSRKVSIWNWMGTLILSAIPGVNIIAMILFIIFAKAPSKRSYAIAFLLLTLILALLGCAALIIFEQEIALLADRLRGVMPLDTIGVIS